MHWGAQEQYNTQMKIIKGATVTSEMQKNWVPPNHEQNMPDPSSLVT
jgi:hypothetical protein